MDAVTAMTIDKGRKNEQLLVQPVHQPMAVEQQIAILYCGTHGLLKDIPLEKVDKFEREFLTLLEIDHQHDVLEPLKQGQIDDQIGKIIESVAADTVKKINSGSDGTTERD